ncbi:hypothetical protein [Mucilaginibacter myungsuensis]|uniref:Uncharacterized protein n=1 Tax=Mucilaginibacter myungsuensis TaxID=649104 RepID=A0A929KXC7_9SPHI|nr:hypothetical protein [Mucilaginibacter myungsuensis]MBE9661673.1 hypothetical protein [Mucilaginibacter myungsuensis]MDN3597817.1 hypothetical protein [Mucilaginibacter myungsuensis]
MIKWFVYIVFLLVFTPCLLSANAPSGRNRRTITEREVATIIPADHLLDTNKHGKPVAKADPKVKEVPKTKVQPKPEKLEDPDAAKKKPARERRPDGMQRPPELPRRSDN